MRSNATRTPAHFYQIFHINFFTHMKFQSLIIATALCAVASAQNTHSTLARPDGHAPISIMADHTHNAGEWMFSYRYMFMEMDGMYQGSSSVSPARVFTNNYTVTPTRMTMDMHMLGVMYAPNHRFTLSAMLPYLSSEMYHTIFPGAAPLIKLNNGDSHFTTNSSGFGDVKLSSLIRLVHRGPHHFHGTLGLSLPTGSIGEKDSAPGPGGILERQLPAAMQPGSGTFDLLPSVTYTYLADRWSAGVQVNAVLRTGKNSHGYRLGDQLEVTSWFAYKPSDTVSVSSGLSYRWEDELQGNQTDVLLNPPFAPARRTVPTAFSGNYGGQRLELLSGVNFVIPSGIMKNHRLAADLRLPIWQDRNGLGLGTDYTLSLGWQYAF
jgi:hypothetical protein